MYESKNCVLYVDGAIILKLITISVHKNETAPVPYSNHEMNLIKTINFK